MLILGVTGSIAMGKSEAARMLRSLGVPVFDADAAVHALYAKGGEAVPPIEAAFPGVTVHGAIDRNRLSAAVLGRPEALQRLEAIIHPLVRQRQQRFLADAREAGAKLAALDIPLLFETGGESRCDRTMVVSAPYEVQRARVLGRPGMTEEKFQAIVAQQMPDAEKRRRADYVIDTSGSLDATLRQIRELVTKLEEEAAGSDARNRP